METNRNLIIAAAVIVIAGILLYVVGNRETPAPATAPAPAAAPTEPAPAPAPNP